jgi:hypothetical protein
MGSLTFSLPHFLTLSLSRAWAAWKRLARLIGEFNGRIVLTLLYAVLIVPVGFILRLVADPLRRRRPQVSNWTSRPPTPATLDEARRQ